MWLLGHVCHVTYNFINMLFISTVILMISSTYCWCSNQTLWWYWWIWDYRGHCLWHIVFLKYLVSLLLPFSGICGSAYRKFVWVELIIKITVDMNNIFMKLYVTWQTWPKSHMIISNSSVSSQCLIWTPTIRHNYLKYVPICIIHAFILCIYKPDIVWPDGDFGPNVYWKSQELLVWLCNDRYDSLVYLSSDTVTTI
jgi:hypothetical protein